MPTELALLGTFRLPTNVSGWNPSYSFGPLAYWPSHDSLLIRGHNLYPNFCEIKIPSVLDGRVAAANGVGFDPTGGRKDPSWPVSSTGGTNVAGIGGCVIDEEDNFTGTIAIWYNVGNVNVPCVFRANLRTGEFHGYWKTTNKTLKTAGPMVRLGSKLRNAWNHDIGMFLSSGSGTASTCAGPGLFTFRNNIATDAATLSDVARIDWDQQSNPYLYGNPPKPWSGNGNGVSYASAVIDMGYQMAWLGWNCADDGHYWYGYGTEGGYVDPRYPTNKAYHANKYAAKLWTISTDDLLAGRKNIAEQDISALIPGDYKMYNACADVTTGRLFVLAWKMDAKPQQSSFPPLMLVFKFKTETEMQAELDALQAALTALQAAAAAVTAERDVLRSEVVSLTDTVTTVTTQRDQLQAKINAAVAALQ